VPRSPLARLRALASSRDRRTPLAVALLVTLLVLLATFQYRWTGEVERAEEERARVALSRTAWSVSGELDGELGRLYGHFGGLAANPAAEIPGRLAAWRASALEPGILCAILLARLQAEDWTLERFDESRGGGDASDDSAGTSASASAGDSAGTSTTPTPGEVSAGMTPMVWPAELLPLRERLAARLREPRTSFRRNPEPAVLVPALIAPLGGGFRGTPFFAGSRIRRQEKPVAGGAPPALGEPPGILILWLDTQVLSGALLPELIARHFGTGIDYRVEVLGARGERLYARGPELGRARPDAVVPLYALHGALRFSDLQAPGRARSQGPEPFGMHRWLGRPERRSDRNAGPLPGSGEAGAQWQLTVTHPAGSLSAAVARARFRNLGISLAILVLLAASVLLVLLNSRRAEALARRQIELVAGVSHELLTPVAALRSAGENLATGVVTEPEAVRRYGDLLVRESSRLGSLVEQVLTWAGLQTRGLPEARQEIDASDLLAGVAESAAPAAEAAGVRLETAVARGVAPFRGDRIALERALRNLVENALKYGAAGGWIGLGAEPLAGRRGWLGRRDDRPGVTLWVEDRGPGVDPADLPHLFEPFYRGRNGAAERGREPTTRAAPLPGSGLGLALVAQIAREHGGRARVAPAAPRGLRFTLELPGSVAAGENAQAAGAVRAAPAADPAETAAHPAADAR
jgi:signal transduction histidine kinase